MGFNSGFKGLTTSLMDITQQCGLRQRRRYSDSLPVRRSGHRICAGVGERTRFSAPVQASPRSGPASCTGRTWSLPGVKRPRCGVHHPSPSSAKVKEKVEIYFHSPSGPSWSVLEWTLPHRNTFFVWKSLHIHILKLHFIMKVIGYNENNSTLIECNDVSKNERTIYTMYIQFKWISSQPTSVSNNMMMTHKCVFMITGMSTPSPLPRPQAHCQMNRRTVPVTGLLKTFSFLSASTCIKTQSEQTHFVNKH